ncbi:E3 SUMO-protein ligase PIAS1-like [Metopolophium dirhodum]|uniref:E3 SUMO-protein ligase PIAS1-like n=1 Tax=Metopolophium dirhodum TaxID=44670 RepID=UPI00298F5B53|nr:E3 SUMO-protein ligase PIAS1-like [Metopolophium dirhodum]XP_060856999.1 E3 SUMO-protein ligase PIAS1-like [Metopolophium dirhodum]
MHYQSSTPLGPNPIEPIVETTSSAIQFEKLPFFKTVKQLTKPMHLKSDSNKLICQFKLQDRVKSSILKSWNFDRKEYKFQIILRLQQIGLNENVKERLPYNIRVSVNGHQCILPELNDQLNPEIVQWRNNDPIDITEQTDLRKFGLPNILEITWSQEPHSYIGCIYVAQKLTWNDLLVELEKRPKRDSDKIKELFTESMENDDDMLEDFLVASVQDPFTNLRMNLPALGVDCRHLQCFDAIQFLQMNEQKQTWKCPICKNKIKFENIVICEFFLNILQSNDLTEECDNVVFFKDGTWSESITNASQSTNDIEDLTLSDSDSEERNLDNVDSDEITLKPKRFKYNPPEVVEINNRLENMGKSRKSLIVITLG